MVQGKDYIGVGVGAMIFDDQGRLLMTKRGEKCKNERGCWEVPGGSIEFGETAEEALIREVKEEIAVDIEIISRLHAFDHLIPEEGQHWIALPFVAKIVPGQTPQIMEPDKAEMLDWFALDALPSPLAATTKPNIEIYLRSQE